MFRLPGYYLTSVALTALIAESLPECYLRNRKRTHSAYMAMFMWITVGSLMAHAYR